MHEEVDTLAASAANLYAPPTSLLDRHKRRRKEAQTYHTMSCDISMQRFHALPHSARRAVHSDSDSCKASAYEAQCIAQQHAQATNTAYAATPAEDDLSSQEMSGVPDHVHPYCLLNLNESDAQDNNNDYAAFGFIGQGFHDCD